MARVAPHHNPCHDVISTEKRGEKYILACRGEVGNNAKETDGAIHLYMNRETYLTGSRKCISVHILRRIPCRCRIKNNI